jgi:uncharacterized protein YecT (DUF1311 family)
MKKTVLCLLLLTGSLPLWRANAQTVTQEQCQQADAQLNQIYQQLRGTLNDVQKQQLKLAQRDWIKKRDAFVAANRSNPQGALYQATMQRVGELTGSLGKLTCTEKLPSGTSTIATNSNKQVIFQASQGVTQAKCDEADAKLNQLYQQLLGSLNEDQEQQLKLAQRDWIKKRDAHVAEESINRNERYYNTTMERVWDFQAVLIRFENGSNEIGLIKSLELKPISSSRFAAIKKIIECLKISDLGESIEKEIIELKDRLNGCKELIKPKLEDQNQFLEPIVSRGWNYRERADMSKHLNALWPREKDSEWKLKWKEPEPTVQTEHKEKTISKASSHNMVAKSYKNDTSIYI